MPETIESLQYAEGLYWDSNGFDGLDRLFVAMREMGLETLLIVTAVAAADLARWIPIAVSDAITSSALRQLLVGLSIHRSVGKRIYSTLLSKFRSRT